VTNASSAGSTHQDAGIVLMPHTHWDREWYEPFQVFRFRLVEVLDDVIERAVSDPQFRFTLDGQTAAIEDYL
jgi:alpha-mannosidase